MTPLEIRQLEHDPIVEIVDGPRLAVEYAGAAPGLVAGATQINVKLPDAAPEPDLAPAGSLLLSVQSVRSSNRDFVTISVAPD